MLFQYHRFIVHYFLQACIYKTFNYFHRLLQKDEFKNSVEIEAMLVSVRGVSHTMYIKTQCSFNNIFVEYEISE